MELEDSVLNFSDEDESFEDDEDVKMNDIEDGELVEKISKTELEETSGACASSENPLPGQKNRRRRKNKGKNKRKRVSSGPITDINKSSLSRLISSKNSSKTRKQASLERIGDEITASSSDDLLQQEPVEQSNGGAKRS